MKAEELPAPEHPLDSGELLFLAHKMRTTRVRLCLPFIAVTLSVIFSRLWSDLQEYVENSIRYVPSAKESKIKYMCLKQGDES